MGPEKKSKFDKDPTKLLKLKLRLSQMGPEKWKLEK